MSRALRTPGLPPAHGPVGYRWQNTGSHISLINTRATSCRTEAVGVQVDPPGLLDVLAVVDNLHRRFGLGGIVA